MYHKIRDSKNTHWISCRCLVGLVCTEYGKKKGGKAPYYVGAAQTLPRGMYSDRNKNAVGEYSLFSKCLSSLWFLAMMQKVC